MLENATPAQLCSYISLYFHSDAQIPHPSSMASPWLWHGYNLRAEWRLLLTSIANMQAGAARDESKVPGISRVFDGWSHHWLSGPFCRDIPAGHVSSAPGLRFLTGFLEQILQQPWAVRSECCGLPSVPLSQRWVKGQLWALTSQGQGGAWGEAMWVFPPALLHLPLASGLAHLSDACPPLVQHARSC